MSDYAWVCCPHCQNDEVIVTRNIGDVGGTESLTIDCFKCNHTETVVP